MIYLSQRDARWANIKLGKSNQTIGRSGCTTTSLTMGLNYFGFPIQPPYIANQDTYTIDGYILWSKLDLPGSFKLIKRIGSTETPIRDDKAILESLRSTNGFVLLNVNHGTHWVLALSKVWFKNDYYVADPWLGDRRTACGAYQNIVGSAHFAR